jgi:hypothetical protein
MWTTHGRTENNNYFYQAIKRGIRVKRGIRDEDYQMKGK